MTDWGERIREAREAAGLSQSELARRVGLKPPSVHDWESGKTKRIGGDNLMNVARALGTTPDWILTGRDSAQTLTVREPLGRYDVPHFQRRSEPEHAEVPVWDARAAAGGGAVNGEQAGPKGSILFRSRSLSKQGISTKHSHVWYVHGDSMVPRLRDGDAVLFDASDKTVRAGKVYVLRKGEETFVKRLYREGSRYRVVSDNKADPQWQDWFVEADDPDFEIIGRVRWVGSWEE